MRSKNWNWNWNLIIWNGKSNRKKISLRDEKISFGSMKNGRNDVVYPFTRGKRLNFFIQNVVSKNHLHFFILFDFFSFWAKKFFFSISKFYLFFVWIFAVKNVKIQSPEVKRCVGVIRCVNLIPISWLSSFSCGNVSSHATREPAHLVCPLSLTPDSHRKKGRSTIVCVTYYTGALVGPNVWPRLPVAYCGRLLVHTWSRYHGLHS